MEKERNQPPTRGVDKKIPRKVTPELVQDCISQSSEKEKSPKKKGKKGEKSSDSLSLKSLTSNASETSSTTIVNPPKNTAATLEPKSYKDAIIDSDKKKIAVKKESVAVSMSMIDLCDGDISESTISDYSMKTTTASINSTGAVSSKSKSEKSKSKIETNSSSLFDLKEIEPADPVESKSKKGKTKSPTKSSNKESPVKINKNKRSQSESGNKENTIGSSLMDLDCDIAPAVVPPTKIAQPSKVESSKPPAPKKTLQSELLSKALSSPLKSPPSIKAVKKPNLKSVAEEPKIALSEVEMALNESKMLLQRRKDRK